MSNYFIFKMSKCTDINKDVIFIPTCKECKNILNIKINPLNFSLEYKCEYNEKHNSSDNIYFKTFERFYLDQKKCKNTIKTSKYNKSEKNYSSDCFSNNDEDNCSNLFINDSKCVKHNYNFVAYCLDCKSNLCLFCIKESNKHDSHVIKNYNDLMQNLNEVENLKKKIEEKIKHTNILIEKNK